MSYTRDLLQNDILDYERSYEAKIAEARRWQGVADTVVPNPDVIKPAEHQAAIVARIELIVAWCLADAERDRENAEASRGALRRVSA